MQLKTRNKLALIKVYRVVSNIWLED